MKKKNKNSIIKSCLIIAIILVVIGISTPTLLKNLKFGLDLQGGFEVLYQVKSIDGKKVNNDMLQNTYKTISKRIDVLGVSEPSIAIIIFPSNLFNSLRYFSSKKASRTE